jgi:hypothetical protein
MIQISQSSNSSSQSVVFQALPDILIQDPERECAYFLLASQLETHRTSKEIWERVGFGTVTFVIPDENFIEEVPPFNSCPDENPSVLIQYPHGETAYFLDFEQLQSYKVTQPLESVEYGISFVIPISVELIEELPAVMRALLQSGESPGSSRV